MCAWESFTRKLHSPHSSKDRFELGLVLLVRTRSHVEFVYNMADEVPKEEVDEILLEFLSWCDTNGLILSKKVC